MMKAPSGLCRSTRGLITGASAHRVDRAPLLPLAAAVITSSGRGGSVGSLSSVTAAGWSGPRRDVVATTDDAVWRVALAVVNRRDFAAVTDLEGACSQRM
jgi:hypothetical protein